FLIAVYRRVDDGVVNEADFLLHLLVPTAGVLLKRLIELGVGAESGQKRSLVIGAAAHPAVRQARPFRNRVARADQIFGIAGSPVKPVCQTAAARIGFDAEYALALLLMQGVVQAGQHAHRVTERRMDRDVFNSLSVDPNLPPIAYALDVFVSGKRPRACSLAVRALALCIRWPRGSSLSACGFGCCRNRFGELRR